MKKAVYIVIPVLLLVAGIAVATYFYFNKEKEQTEQAEANKEVEDLKKELERQKKANQEILQLAELDKQEMETQYQEFANQFSEMRARVKNDSLAKKLAAEQARTEELLKQLKQMKPTENPRDVEEIARLKKELETCRAVIRSYVMEIDSLNRVNTGLRQENVQVRAQYEEAQSQITNLHTEKAALSEKVAIAAQLDAVGISLSMKDKKEKPTTKLKNCKTFQVNFALARNVTATSGNKTVYIVINTPAGSVLGGGGSFTYENRTLTCTAKRTVEYGGEETPITIYREINEALDAGTYHVSIFADGKMIGSRSFTLNL